MHPPLGQHQVDPQRQRELQRLADEAAARPQEQVLGGLLGDGRAAAHLGDVVGVLDRGAKLGPVDAVMGAEPAVLGRDHACAAAPARSAPAARRCARPACRAPSGPASGSRPDRSRGTAASADRAAAARPRTATISQRTRRKAVLRGEPELVIGRRVKHNSSHELAHRRQDRDRARTPRLPAGSTPRPPRPSNCSTGCWPPPRSRARSRGRIASSRPCATRASAAASGCGRSSTVETAALFGVPREQALMAGAAIELRALLFAGARRPAGDGRRRSAPRPADRAQEIRRGDRDPGRRRPAHLRLRRAGAAGDPSRCRGAHRAGHRACPRRRPRRHGRRPDARPRRRRPLRQERHAAGREGRADAAGDEDRRDPEILLRRRRDPRQRAARPSATRSTATAR